MTTYADRFARARKIETLLLMVKKELRELPHVRFNEAVMGYAANADYYAKAGYARAADLFKAAHERFEQIKPYWYEGTC